MTETGRPKLSDTQTTEDTTPKQPRDAIDYSLVRKELSKRMVEKIEGSLLTQLLKQMNDATSKKKWKNALDAIGATGVNVSDVREQMFPPDENNMSDLAQKLMNDVTEVIKIKPRNEGDPYNLRVLISGRTLILSSKDIQSFMEFRRRWYEETNELLLPLDDVEWGLVVNSWQDKTREEETPISPEDYVVDDLLMKLTENKVTANRDLAKMQSDYFWVEQDIRALPDEAPYVLLYHNHHLTQKVQSLAVKTTLEKIHVLLKPYLAEPCRQVRVHGIVSRFWVFKKDFAEIDWREKFIAPEEEKDDETPL